MGVVPRGAHRLIEGRGAGARRVWGERAKSKCATGGHASLPWGESSTPPPPVCPGSPPHSCLLAPSAAPCLFGGGGSALPLWCLWLRLWHWWLWPQISRVAVAGAPRLFRGGGRPSHTKLRQATPT